MCDGDPCPTPNPGALPLCCKPVLAVFTSTFSLSCPYSPSPQTGFSKLVCRIVLFQVRKCDSCNV